MRSITELCFSPDGMSSNAVFHGRGDCTQAHDDHAVTTIILQGSGNHASQSYAHAGADDHSHDEGLVHSHEWATSAPMTR